MTDRIERSNYESDMDALYRGPVGSRQWQQANENLAVEVDPLLTEIERLRKDQPPNAIQIVAFIVMIFSVIAMVGLWITSVMVQGLTGKHYLTAGWICLVPTLLFGIIAEVLD